MNSGCYSELKLLLDESVKRYNNTDFISDDPIQIPKRFTRREDIEIAGFLTATIAWGNRKSIIKSAGQLMELMDNCPYDYVMNEGRNGLNERFVHRTFNTVDCNFFIRALHDIYTNRGGLEGVFSKGFATERTVFGVLKHFRTVFLQTPHDRRSEKHLSDVTSNSSAKRLNMFLRWMVRKDDNKVDFGLWHYIPASALMLPLDVHTGDVARALGMLTRKQNDWKAVMEITDILRTFDADDPVKYDFALFGMGVNGHLE